MGWNLIQIHRNTHNDYMNLAAMLVNVISVVVAFGTYLPN